MKMKNSLIALCIAIGSIIMLSGCTKEDGVTASADLGDAFVRIDNPAIASDHQVYLFYKETGIPVLFSDTLRKQPLAVYDPKYFITTRDSLLTLRLAYKEADRLQGINFIQNQIYPHLGGKAIKPYSFLLVDSVYSFKGTGINRTKVPYSSYLSFGGLIVGNLPRLKTMTTTQLSAFKVEILVGLIYNPMLNSSLLAEFYTVSASSYGKTAYGTVASSFYVPFAPKTTYGLLPNGTELPTATSYAVGAKEADFKEYLTQMLTLSPQEFATKYSAFPLVMRKYTLVEQALITIGYKR
jgi:hypothetical protein